jgi:site-specific recombinase XerD
MSQSEPAFEPWLAKLREHVQVHRYGVGVAQNYPVAIRRFLRNLKRRRQAIETISPSDVEHYLDSLRLKRYRGPFPDHSRRMHRAAIRMLLRLVHGQWPPEILPSTAHEHAARATVTAFDAWMKDLRGLSPSTRRHRRAEAYRLLEWIHEHAKTADTVTVSDIDGYVEWRSASMRRTSIAEMAATLRAVLRYLHDSGHMRIDLASLIRGPTTYALEGIPSTIRPEDVRRALGALEQDRSPLGRRDYAIWMLLTSYGLRAGEIRALCLADIDWRHERLRIRHTKTGAYTELPLLPEPANALLNYLRHGRPATTARAVFLRHQAPYRALSDSTSLHGIVTRRLTAVGVVATGKRGPHALRHARAVSLLRGGVPLKVIGDVLGHRSERSTLPYLKLATDDLRLVALDVPAGVAL